MKDLLCTKMRRFADAWEQEHSTTKPSWWQRFFFDAHERRDYLGERKARQLRGWANEVESLELAGYMKADEPSGSE